MMIFMVFISLIPCLCSATGGAAWTFISETLVCINKGSLNSDAPQLNVTLALALIIKFHNNEPQKPETLDKSYIQRPCIHVFVWILKPV